MSTHQLDERLRIQENTGSDAYDAGRQQMTRKNEPRRAPSLWPNPTCRVMVTITLSVAT